MIEYNILSEIKLLKPRFEKVNPVFEAFKHRKTIREMSEKDLPLQILSNLLWVGCGINRKIGPFDISGKTAASASNSQEIDVFVAMEKGVYLYDAAKHKLNLVLKEDIRKLAIGTGQRNSGDIAPVRLIFVADVFRLSHTAGYQEPGLQAPEVQMSYYYVDTGMIAANIYLYASSQGLACWFHNCNRSEVAKKLKLGYDQRVLFGQTIGFPIKSSRQK